MWLTILLVLGVLVALLHYFYTRHNDYWKLRNVPYVPQSTLWKNLKSFFDNEHLSAFDKNIYEELKGHPFGGSFELTKPVLVARDPELIKDIFIRDFSHFTDRRSVGDILDHDKVAKKMLTLLKGQQWKEVRSALSPTFTTGRMKRIFHIMTDGASELIKYIKSNCDNGETEMFVENIHERLSLHVIASAAFGTRSDAFEEKDSLFLAQSKKFQRTNLKNIIKVLTLMLFPKLKSVIKFTMMDEDSTAFYKSFIEQAIADRKNSKKGDPNFRDDFLQLLMEVSTGEGEESAEDKSVSKKEILDADDLFGQSMLFLLAGFDTVSTVITFATYELALNPEVQKKLFEEVKNVTDSGPITYDRLPELSYLDKVIQETLRKYPPAARLERECVEDYQILGTSTIIEKGKLVSVPLYAIQRDEQYYPDPEKFDPERFSEEEKSKRPSCVHMPFGQGPRNCIGIRFAQMEVKVALAELVRNFEYEPSAKTVIPVEFEKFASLMRIKGGTWLKVTPRA